MLSHYHILGAEEGGMRENNSYCFLLCHAIVSDNVVALVCTDHQSPSQAQLKSPFGDSCFLLIWNLIASCIPVLIDL